MAVININRNQFEEMVHSGKTVWWSFQLPGAYIAAVWLRH